MVQNELADQGSGKTWKTVSRGHGMISLITVLINCHLVTSALSGP